MVSSDLIRQYNILKKISPKPLLIIMVVAIIANLLSGCSLGNSQSSPINEEQSINNNLDESEAKGSTSSLETIKTSGEDTNKNEPSSPASEEQVANDESSKSEKTESGSSPETKKNSGKNNNKKQSSSSGNSKGNKPEETESTPSSETTETPDEDTNKNEPSSPANEDQDENGKSDETETIGDVGGYNAVCFDGQDFVAVGSTGRIDKISTEKKVTHLPKVTDASLNSIISVNGSSIVVGNAGTILLSKNGDDFKPVNSGVKTSLNSITYFNNRFWIAGSQGILLYSDDGEKWSVVQTDTNNDIISITSNNRMIMAVTRESQILMSTNGSKWDILDYNAVYKGFDDPYWFHSIRALGDLFFISGEYQETPGMPKILFSDTGEVWMASLFLRINDKPLEEFLPLKVNTVGPNGDQLLGICNDGKILTINDCAKCHMLSQITNHNINDIAVVDGLVALVGDEFWFSVYNVDDFRQYKILPEQAKIEMENGAKIIDVRGYDEYNELHIKGAINIPVDQISTTLEQIIPDKSTKIIFYCGMGARSQAALEEAIKLGYKEVYNLGGLNDWPFEKE